MFIVRVNFAVVTLLEHLCELEGKGLYLFADFFVDLHFVFIQENTISVALNFILNDQYIFEILIGIS